MDSCLNGKQLDVQSLSVKIIGRTLFSVSTYLVALVNVNKNRQTVDKVTVKIVLNTLYLIDMAAVIERVYGSL